ncbi:MAG: sigma-54-dependent transcriptional regulator [Candidatus Methylomirabilales bacterium]
MSREGRIVVIDDEPDMLESCARILRRLGHDVRTAATGPEGLDLVKADPPAVVLTDLRMSEMDGLQVLQEVKRIDPEIVVLVFTAFATIENAVEAVKAGAFDYIPKPFTVEQLEVAVGRAFEQRSLREENRRLRDQLADTYKFENIVGRSLPMLEVYELIKKVARSDANILIVGESGTGKELVARSLHVNSWRSVYPFVPVDCASLPEHLLESELFGHEKGAFTGAYAARAGLFEVGNRGTVFLDEVGELPLNLQVKLLRVLQERQVRRVGGNRLVDVDVRVISASNRDLKALMADGHFREDLFYRLHVIGIELPPLRERSGDIPLLAQHFLKHYVKREQRRMKGITDEAMGLLERYHWPGNVRELQNVIERAVVLIEGEYVTARELPEHLREKAEGGEDISVSELSLKAAKQRAVQSFERAYLTRVLGIHGGNISKAARAAGVDRKTIHRLLRKHKLSARSS